MIAPAPLAVTVCPIVDDTTAVPDHLGFEFIAGDVTVVVIQGSDHPDDREPAVFYGGRPAEGFSLAEIEHFHIALGSILTDSRFQAARRAA